MRHLLSLGMHDPGSISSIHVSLVFIEKFANFAFDVIIKLLLMVSARSKLVCPKINYNIVK